MFCYLLPPPPTYLDIFIRRLRTCVCEGPDTTNTLTAKTTYPLQTTYVCCTSLTTRSSTHSYVGIWVSTHHVCNHTPTFLLPPSTYILTCPILTTSPHNHTTTSSCSVHHRICCALFILNDNTLYLPPPLPHTS